MRFLLFASGSLFLLALVCWLTYRSGRLLAETEIDFNLLLAPAENVARLVLIGLCLLLGWRSGLPAAQLGWVSTEPATDFVLGLAFGSVVPLTLNPLTPWAVARFGKQVYSPLVIRNILPRNRSEWLGVFVALGPAVLLEELLFRSLLLGGFGPLVHPLALAAGLSLLFGLMHAPQGSLGIAVAGLLGFLLSLLFLWRGSLLPAFVAHYVINLWQLARAARERAWLESY